MATMLKFLFGDLTTSWIYKNEIKATPMHVFSFDYRAANTGITSVCKFLKEYTDVQPALVSPGVKAALKRIKIEPKKKTPSIKNLLIRIEALEEQITFLQKPIKVIEPKAKKVLSKKIKKQRIPYGTSNLLPRDSKLKIIDREVLKDGTLSKRYICKCACGNVTKPKYLYDLKLVKTCGFRCSFYTNNSTGRKVHG
jgi:hypothetical protein